MTTYAYPTAGDFEPQTYDFGLRPSVSISTSPASGAVQTVELPGARWVQSLTYAPANAATRAAHDAFWAKVRAQANRIQMPIYARLEPRGTMRGTPTLASSAAKGATSVAITGSGTLLAGDFIGIGGYVYIVSADASLSSVPIAPPLRAAANSGAAVTWNRPTTLWVVVDSEVRTIYSAGQMADAYTVQMVEVFA